ncbi:DUF975 family protein [Gorillibacterium timonense]|uniref:DUF975 family protein n=1 Tax=Gorillibacterium timonense TaxID=1689269 RepID=UPI00071E3FF1|nr:DUF975 family protein [Gorillibacterium timonense]
MEWSSKQYRQAAFASLQGKWGLAVGITLFSAVVSVLLQNTSNNLVFLTDLLSWLITFLLTVGSSWIFLEIARGNRPQFSNLFDGFRSFTSVIWTGILQSLLVIVATLPGFVVLFLMYGILPYGQIDAAVVEKNTGAFLLILIVLVLIPSLYVGLKTSMTLFLLKDKPELRGWRAIKASWSMMKGLTWKLLVLELTFFGWMLLAMLTFGIGLLWLLPYIGTTTAVFYEKNKPSEAFAG